MPLSVLSADPLQTDAHVLVIGINSQGGVEVNPLETRLRDRFPVFFSDYRRAKPALGELYLFRESTPLLLGMVIRESAASITRPRHVEQALLNLTQSWQREGFQSLAIAPFCPDPEWTSLKSLLYQYLDGLPIPVTIIESSPLP